MIPLVVNIGSVLGQSLFLTVTLSSGQEDWSASPDNHSFEAHIRRMAHFGGWCRIVISFGNGPDNHFLWKWPGQSFPRADSFSPSCTFFSDGGMA
jgi:hypothetical protein